MSPIRAEVIGADYLFTMLSQLPGYSGPWAARLKNHAKANLLVLRPLLISGSDYADHLARVRDWGQRRIRKDLIEALRHLPEERYWMIELSLPELFSANRRKVGEILVRAQVTPGSRRDLSAFLLARLPGCFALYSEGGAAKPKYRFIPSGAQGHVELYSCEERL